MHSTMIEFKKFYENLQIQATFEAQPKRVMTFKCNAIHKILNRALIVENKSSSCNSEMPLEHASKNTFTSSHHNVDLFKTPIAWLKL